MSFSHIAMEEEITKEDPEKNVVVIRDGVSQSNEDSLACMAGLALESQQSKPCPISVLPDKDLLFIFTHLPPYDRLIASEVCKRWHGISRLPWLDVSGIDLSPIPNPNIRPIIHQCPKLKSVFALGKAFSRSDLGILARIPLSSLKLYRCVSDIVSGDEEDDESEVFWDGNLLPLVFANGLPIADWEELILNDFRMPTNIDWTRDEIGICSREGQKLWRNYRKLWYHFRVTGENLPVSLKRLLLAGVCASKHGDPQDRAPALSYFDFQGLLGFTHLQNLTCLILISSYDDNTCLCDNFELDLQTLPNLRELFLGSFLIKQQLNFDIVALGLSRLEVLFLNNVQSFCGDRPDEFDLVPLVTEHPALRILCITGWYPHEHVIPVRRLFPNGFAAKPVPLLYIFLGKMAAENIVFERSSPDALKVLPITQPLPTFLEKEEIAPILRGVWIALQIKNDAKYGSNSIHDPSEGRDDVSIRVVDAPL